MANEDVAPAKRSLKLTAAIIAAAAVAAFAVIFFYTTSYNSDQWLVSSAYYRPSQGQLAVNYLDIENHTLKGTVSMKKVNGETWHIGNFTGSQQAFIMPNANETPAAPETVTFDLELTDGRKLSKTIKVETVEITPEPTGDQSLEGT